tara:strand:+ start:338 stop:541 length:204 start_codon:yes stop_codon:yes gene_type:complete
MEAATFGGASGAAVAVRRTWSDVARSTAWKNPQTPLLPLPVLLAAARALLMLISEVASWAWDGERMR